MTEKELSQNAEYEFGISINEKLEKSLLRGLSKTVNKIIENHRNTIEAILGTGD